MAEMKKNKNYGFFSFVHYVCHLPPLPKVQCPNFLDFRNPWGKRMERRGLRSETFAHKGCKITAQTKVCFFGEFCLTSMIFWCRWYFFHWSRDSLSPICGIFQTMFTTLYISHVTFHMSCVMCQVSNVTCHMSHVTCYMSHVTCHMSHVTCHMSCVTCHFFFFLFFRTKW